MREGMGLYKAKRIDNGEWVYGYLLRGERTYIITSDAVHYMVVSTAYHCSVELIEVIPETIGQWTGLVDKNGVKIFEGDLVTIENTKKQGMPACVRWEQENCQFVASRIGYQPINLGCFEDKTQWVVIGNIHDKAVEE